MLIILYNILIMENVNGCLVITAQA